MFQDYFAPLEMLNDSDTYPQSVLEHYKTAASSPFNRLWSLKFFEAVLLQHFLSVVIMALKNLICHRNSNGTLIWVLDVR